MAVHQARANALQYPRLMDVLSTHLHEEPGVSNDSRVLRLAQAAFLVNVRSALHAVSEPLAEARACLLSALARGAGMCYMSTAQIAHAWPPWQRLESLVYAGNTARSFEKGYAGPEPAASIRLVA